MKGRGGSRRSYKKWLSFLFAGRDTDKILDGLIELANDATWGEKAAACADSGLGVPQGAGARDIARVIQSHSAIRHAVLHGDPMEAKRAIVRLVGCQSTTSDQVVQAVLQALTGAR